MKIKNRNSNISIIFVINKMLLMMKIKVMTVNNKKTARTQSRITMMIALKLSK